MVFVTYCLIGCLRLYRLTLGHLIGGRCRFAPSCSYYAERALAWHGCLAGGMLIAKRLLCCHPFHPGGVDCVPPPLPKEPYLT